MEFEIAATKVFQQLGFPSTKPEQLQVVMGILNQRDVFAVLPTGFGKSLCFQCLPLLFDQLFPADGSSIVLVVTPLTAIMKDQVAGLSQKGVRASYISGDQHNPEVKEGVIKGDYQVVYITPEMLLENRKWRKMLVGEVYAHRLRTFVIDEAHTVAKWGKTFRKVLSRIGEVRSLLPSHVNIMALTATATTKLRIDVAQIIGMKNELVVSLSPSKSNIMFAVTHFKSIEDTFLPIAERLRREGSQCPRMIVYCRRFEDCADMYLFFRGYLGANFTEPPGAPDLPKFRLVDMYMSCTDPIVKEAIVTAFTNDSCLRVVVATIAFGMGIDCPDVRQVINLGSPSDLESYVQETGRAGRDNLPSLAILVSKARTSMHIEKTMLWYLSNDTFCRRDALFQNFDKYSRSFTGPLCMCCDICLKSCNCSKCSTNHQSFVFLD